MSYIELLNIEKSFDDKKIIKNVSLNIAKGEFVSFLGPSGCGKTTLLRCLAGLEKIDKGAFILDGNDISDKPVSQRKVSMIFQHYSLFPTMNVFDNVSFGLRMNKTPRDEIEVRVKAILEMVNLKGHEKKYVYQLSGGEQQRVALARGLIMNPKVFLLDEPFSAIDAKLRKELQLYLKEIHKELDMTTIFVTHDQEEAMRISDTIHLFNEGRLEQSGLPQAIYANPKSKFVASFIGHYNQFEGDVFRRLTNHNYISTEQVAFRPEIVHMSSSKVEKSKDSYILKGVIKTYVSYGSIIRYGVLCDSEVVDVDVLFNKQLEWKIGDYVYLQVDKQFLVHY